MTLLNEINNALHSKTPTGGEHTLDELLVKAMALRLPTIKAELPRLINDPQFLSMNTIDQLCTVLDCELINRRNGRITRAIKYAELTSNVTGYTMLNERSDMLARSGVPVAMAEYFFDRDEWLKRGEHIVILGKTGTGKTDFGSAMLHTLILLGHKVKSYQFSLFTRELTAIYAATTADNIGIYKQTLNKIASHDAIFIDDFCLTTKCLPGTTEILKDVIDACDRKHCGIIVATQKSLEACHKLLGGDEGGDSVIDRLMPRRRIITLKSDESHRVLQKATDDLLSNINHEEPLK